MHQRGPSQEAYDRMAETMWRFTLERALEECPDYRFYERLPSELLSVAEYPVAFAPRLPGVHESYFNWPRRDTFSYTTRPLTPEQVVARLDMSVEYDEREEDSESMRRTHWRHLRLTAGERELRDVWDIANERGRFSKPWPPTAAQVLEERARRAVDFDDGRSDDEWLALQEPEQREHFRRVGEMEGMADVVPDMLNRDRQSAWQLYRFLGAEPYEALTAGYREPLAAALFAAADADARAAAQKTNLQRLGQCLRAARTELGLSVERVVELTGLTKARVQGAERGTGVLKLTDLLTLSELYRLPVEQLLAEPEPKPDERAPRPPTADPEP